MFDGTVTQRTYEMANGSEKIAGGWAKTKTRRRWSTPVAPHRR